MLVKIWMLKTILIKSSMEMRNTLLNNGRKATFVIKQQRIWLNCVCVLVFPGT